MDSTVSQLITFHVGFAANQALALPNRTLVREKFTICTVPKYRAAVDYTPRLRAPRNLPRCTANSDTYRQ